MPEMLTGGKKVPFKTADDLISAGEKFPKLEPLRMEKGQAARQTAYLCYSSGTSGLPVSNSPASIETILKVIPEKANPPKYG